jgi:hypothetical protein
MFEAKDICFVSSHYPLEQYYAQRCRKSFEKYTNKHGYHFFYDEDLPESTERHILHFKRCVSIEKASIKYPDTKWFVWVDSDVYVNKYDLPVESQIDLTDTNILYHLFHENPWHYPINTGVKFVNKHALQYEKLIWENRNTDPWSSFPFEQKTLYEFILPQIPDKYIIHDPYMLNCIDGPHDAYKKDALFIHLCGRPEDKKNEGSQIINLDE